MLLRPLRPFFAPFAVEIFGRLGEVNPLPQSSQRKPAKDAKSVASEQHLAGRNRFRIRSARRRHQALRRINDEPRRRSQQAQSRSHQE